MLRWELRQKGVADQIIDEALTPLDETASASRLARRRVRRLRDLDAPTFRRRLTDYLARRGFSYSTIADVVQEAWEELHVSEHGQDVAPQAKGGTAID